MAGVGGIEVGRVHIRVVPDFTQFRKEMLEELKKWDGREVTIKVDADRSALAGLSKDLQRSGKAASKEISKEISKGLSKASISPSLNNKVRYKRRLEAQLNKLFNDIEVRLKYKTGNNVELRKQWDSQEKYIRKQLDKITDDMGDLQFSVDAQAIDSLFDKLQKKASIDFNTDSSKPDYGLLEKLARINEINRENNKAIADSRVLLQNWNRALKDAAGSGERIDAAFDRAFGFQQRQALREYVYGYRELNGEVNKYINTSSSGGMGRGVFGNIKESVGSIQQIVERSKLRGGIIGGLFGGAASLGILSAAKDGIINVGKAAAGTAEKVGGLAKGLSPQGLGLNVSVAGFALIAGALTMIAAPLAGLLTTAVLALPGLLATLLVPIGAVVLGFDGIKKAAEEAGLFGDKNGDKKGGGSLGAALTELQTQVQGVFKDKLKEPFGNIGDVASQYIEPLKNVATGVADIMAQTINTMTSPENTRKITETFNAIGDNLSKSFAPAIADFTEGLINLAHQFTTGGALEGVGTWFKETMADFKEWTAGTDLKTQFEGLGATIKIVLDLIGEIGKKGLEFMADPAKVQGFKDTLQGVADIIRDIVGLSKELGALWDVFAAGLKTITAPVAALKDVIANPGSLEKWNNLGKSLIPGVAAGEHLADKWFPNKEELAAKATEAGQAAAKNYTTTVAAVMAANKETQKAMLTEAFTGEGVTTAVQTQMTQQAQIAITGVQQALVPLKEGLQTDINAALMPLGDIAGKVQAAFDGVPAMVQGSLGQIPGIVTAAMGSLATDAQTAMQGLSNAVIEHCAIAVNTATAEAPRVAEPFKALAGQMGQVGADMMSGLGAGIRDNVGIAKAAAEQAAIEVKEAAKAAIRSKSPSKDFMDIGKDTQTGLAIGINDNAKGPISAIREVMQAIKDVFGSAEGINLNFFMGQAATSMSSMATSSKEFRSNMVEAGTTPALSASSTDTAADLEDIKRQKAEINVRIAELQALKNATSDKAAKAALTAEMDQLKIQKSRLDLLKEENGLQEERKTAIQKLSDTIATNIVDMIKMPGEFAKTTANAAMQDIGISGSGAIPTIANWAADAATNYIFNVNNMDDAIQGQQAQQRRQTAGVVGR